MKALSRVKQAFDEQLRPNDAEPPRTIVMFLIAALGVELASPENLGGAFRGNAAATIAAVLLGAGFAVFVRKRGTLSNPLAAVPFLIWSLAGVTTSYNSADTMSAVFVLAVGLFAAFAIAARVTVQEITGGLVRMGLVALALSLVLVVVHPSVARSDIGVSGIYGQKNILGFVLAVAFISTLCTTFRRRWHAVAVLAVLGGGILISHSTTAMLCSAATTMLWALLRFERALRGRQRLRIAAGAVLLGVTVILAAVLLTDPALILRALGKSVTLSARVNIWNYAMFLWSQRPVTGWGLAAVWGDNDFGGAIRAWLHNPAATHAHSGYIDLLLQTGVVGAICFGVLGLVVVRNSLVALRVPAEPGNRWPILLVAFLAIYDVVEMRFFNSLGWFLLMTALAIAGGFARQAAERRRDEQVLEAVPWLEGAAR